MTNTEAFTLEPQEAEAMALRPAPCTGLLPVGYTVTVPGDEPGVRAMATIMGYDTINGTAAAPRYIVSTQVSVAGAFHLSIPVSECRAHPRIWAEFASDLGWRAGHWPLEFLYEGNGDTGTVLPARLFKRGKPAENRAENELRYYLYHAQDNSGDTLRVFND